MLTIKFISSARDVLDALNQEFLGRNEVQILHDNYPKIDADAEYCSVSLADILVPAGQARIIKWKELGKVTSTEFAVVGGIVPNSVDPFSPNAGGITFSAVLEAVSSYNGSNKNSIKSIKLLADWFVTPKAPDLVQQAHALREAYDSYCRRYF